MNDRKLNFSFQTGEELGIQTAFPPLVHYRYITKHSDMVTLT